MTIQVDNYIELLFLFCCLLLFYFVGIYIIRKIDAYLRIKKFEEEMKLILNEDFILRINKQIAILKIRNELVNISKSKLRTDQSGTENSI